MFQELLLELDYFGNKSNEKVNIDLQESLWYTNKIEKLCRNNLKLTITFELKNALTDKMKLRVWGYANSEYLYMLVDGGLDTKILNLHNKVARQYTWSKKILQKELKLNAEFGIWVKEKNKKEDFYLFLSHQPNLCLYLQQVP